MTRAETLQIAKPIIFNTEMVRAILGGTKTGTRWLIKPQPANKNDIIYKNDECGKWFISPDDDNYPETEVKMPYKVGDILYVRETWCRIECENCDGDVLTGEPLSDDCPDETGGCYRYRASCEIGGDARWSPSIHMPKEAARIFLRVRSIYADRLQDINGYGVLAEGVDNGRSNPTMGKRWENMQRMSYANVWNSTVKKADLAKYGWEANPWVWVIEFEWLEVTDNG